MSEFRTDPASGGRGDRRTDADRTDAGPGLTATDEVTRAISRLDTARRCAEHDGDQALAARIDQAYEILSGRGEVRLDATADERAALIAKVAARHGAAMAASVATRSDGFLKAYCHELDRLDAMPAPTKNGADDARRKMIDRNRTAANTPKGTK